MKGKNLVIIILCVLLVALGATSYYMYATSQQYKSEANALEAEITSYEKTVCLLSKSLKAGDVITEEDVYRGMVVSTVDASAFATLDCIGKVVLTDVTEGTPLMADQVAKKEITQTTRVEEIDVVNLPITIQNGQYVDIRIRFPNGEDYIVLPKKKVSNLFLENCVFTTEMEEDEIITLSSAIIDTYCIAGTELYMTTYLAPSVQDALNATYLVRTETIDILTSSPNVLKQMKYTINKGLRLEMEDRLALLSEEQLAAVVAGANLANTASDQALVGIQNGEMEADVSNIYISEDLVAEEIYEEEETTNEVTE